MGPLASNVLKACLRPMLSKLPSNATRQAWESLPSPASVPQGTIIAVDVYDPRLTFPPSIARVQHSFAQPSAVHPHVDLAVNDRFWDHKIRKDLAAPRYTKIELDKRRTQLLVPGTALRAQADDDRIPVMLVQRTLSSTLWVPNSASKSCSINSSTSLAGWTILVPAGWGSAFWHSLVYADTRTAGTRERAQQCFEAGLPSFPNDWVNTIATKREIDAKARLAKAKWERTPPAKRVNYDKLKVRSPWKPELGQIIQDTAARLSLSTLAQPEVPQQPLDGASGQEVAAVDMQPQTGQATPLRQESPWTVSGPLAAKILNEVLQTLRSAKDPLHADIAGRKLREVVEELLNHERHKRQLEPLSAGVLGGLASSGFVQVALHPTGRGKPKYNAMIYRLDEQKARSERQSLNGGKAGRVGYNMPSASARDAIDTPKPTAVDIDRSNPTKRMTASMLMDDDVVDGAADGNEREDQEESDDDDLDGEDDVEQDQIMEVPPSTDIIGHVTAGNLSLARGRGMGIGCVSLAALVEVMCAEHSAELQKGEPNLLVSFRNTASTVIRSATLEVLV